MNIRKVTKIGVTHPAVMPFPPKRVPAPAPVPQRVPVKVPAKV